MKPMDDTVALPLIWQITLTYVWGHLGSGRNLSSSLNLIMMRFSPSVWILYPGSSIWWSGRRYWVSSVEKKKWKGLLADDLSLKALQGVLEEGIWMRVNRFSLWAPKPLGVLYRSHFTEHNGEAAWPAMAKNSHGLLRSWRYTQQIKNKTSLV